MKRQHTIKEIIDTAAFMAKRGEEWQLRSVNSNYELITPSQTLRHLKRKDLTPRELGFIRRVKNYVIKNEIHCKFTEIYMPSDVKYVWVNRQEPNTVMDDVLEIDIDEAYWQTAYLLGVIPEGLYNEGRKENGQISKVARLVALGSLAKKTSLYEFKGNKIVKRKVERMELTENVWYTICKRVSDVMGEAMMAAGKDFLFYWVDGIYMRNTPEAMSRVAKVFTDWGYQWKVRPIQKIEFEVKGFKVYDIGVSEPRPFFYPRKRKRTDHGLDEEYNLHELCNDVLKGRVKHYSEYLKQGTRD